MFSCIKHRAQRGSAITETLLVIPPVLLLFNLIVWVLAFWQDNYFDGDTRVISQVAAHNSTGLLYQKEGVDARNGKITYKIENVGDDIYGDGKAVLPKHSVTITHKISDKQKREIILYRGTNSWVSYPFLRGQYKRYFKLPDALKPADDEEDERVKWFDAMGNEKLNAKDLRKNLQLGS